MYKLFLTWRYMTRRPLSLVAVACLTFSVFVLVVAPSVMNGFQTEFHKRVRGTLSDLAIWSAKPFGLEHDPRTEAELAQLPHVTAVAPYMDNPALDKHLNKIDYCFLRGVVPEQEEKVSRFREYFVSPREIYLKTDPMYESADPELKADLELFADQLPDTVDHDLLYRRLRDGHEDHPGLPACAVGIYYLRAWNLKLGQKITLTTASDEGTIAEDQEFVIVGAFRTGFSENDRRHVILHLETMQRFVKVEGRVSGYSLAMTDYRLADETAAALKLKIKQGTIDLPLLGYFIKTWEQRNMTLLKAVAMEKLLIRMMTFLIVIAASATIFLVLFMAVHTKVRELGILRAVGGTPQGVLSLFVGQGMLIAILGMVLGLGLGVVFSSYINEIADVVHTVTGWHPFPPEVYYLEEIPTRIDAMENAVNFGITLFLGSIAALIPGLLAALKPPLRAIRYE